MAWSLFWQVLAASCQAILTYLGWKVTQSTIHPRRKKWWDAAFISIGILGVASVGVISYRASRTERAHISVGASPYWTLNSFQIDRPIGVNLSVSNVGNGTAVSMVPLAMASIQLDDSVSSQRAAIVQSESWAKAEGGSPSDMQKGGKSLITAYGPRLSPEDISNIASGRRTVFVAGEISFNDDFGSHRRAVCEYAVYHPDSPLIWALCKEHNNES